MSVLRRGAKKTSLRPQGLVYNFCRRRLMLKDRQQSIKDAGEHFITICSLCVGGQLQEKTMMAQWSRVRSETKVNFDLRKRCGFWNQCIEGVAYLRDPHDRFIAAFAQSVSHTTSAQHAELAALWKGLNFLDQKGIKQAEVETDCLLAAHAIHSPEDLSDLSNLGTGYEN
ncbi:hypothetical protein ACLB2K_047485 [Fragaria x ananassa]